MKNNVPEIRFQGFDGEWERKTLGEDVAQIVGGGTPSTSISEYWDGDIDWYSPTEIGKKIFVDGSEKKITHLGLQKSSACILPPQKTILFTSRAGIGDMAILLNEGTTNQGFQSLVLNAQFDTYFIYSMGFLIKRFAVKLSSGSTFLEISGKKLGKMQLRAPYLPEQTKIGTFFKNLDKLITLKQRKLDKLKNVKKSMLEKMFPREGATVPEIRFQGFSGEWGEQDLDNQVYFYSGLTYSPSNVAKSNGTLVLRSSNVKDNQIIHADDVYVKSDVINCTNVNKGDIIVVVRNGSRSLIGKHAQIQYSMKNTVIGAFMTGLRAEQSDFIMSLLDTIQFSKEIEKNLGATINQITTGAFKKMRFMFPAKSEQTQIGTYFKNLDRLISLQQKEIEKLKQIKSSCLSKMFV